MSRKTCFCEDALDPRYLGKISEGKTSKRHCSILAEVNET